MNSTHPIILVVDDAEFVTNLVSVCLDQSGFHAIEAHTGKEALEKASEGEAPDLLIADLNIPDMSGIALAAAFAKLYPRASVLFMSECSRLTASNAWPFPLLPKPFEVETLRARVIKLLGERHPEDSHSTGLNRSDSELQ